MILAGAPEAMLDEALLVIAFAVMSAGLNRERWWRVLVAVRRRGRARAVAGGDPVAPGSRGHPQLAAGERGARGRRELSRRRSPSWAWFRTSTAGTGTWARRSSSASTTCPRSGIYLGHPARSSRLITLLHPRWPSRLPPRDRLTWYVVGLFGFLLALGSNTPLEHLFNSLPLYGHQRLQSRNMITVATAVCVLFAGWLDRTDATAGPRADDPVRPDHGAGARSRSVAALAIWALAAPGSLVHVFAGVLGQRRASPRTVREATVIALAFCVGAAVLVWIRPRLGTCPWSRAGRRLRRRRPGLDGAHEPADADATERPAGRHHAGPAADGGAPGAGWAVRQLRPPDVLELSRAALRAIPDLNIIPGLPSVSGYASIVNGNYESVTHTHEQDDLDIGQLARGRSTGSTSERS